MADGSCDDYRACQWCGEALGEEDGGPLDMHPACGFRGIMGGANHLRGTCSCCGGTDDPDPPGMTKREAAQAAMDYWQQNTKEAMLKWLNSSKR